MTLYTELCDSLDDDRKQHLFHWRDRVFPEEGIDKQWSDVAWHLLAFDRGKLPIGHIGFDGFDLQLRSEPQRVIGVGGVVVRPECQGQGVPAVMFAALHEQAPQLIGVAHFTLFCPPRLVTYYQRHGYTLHRGEVRFMQGAEEVVSTFCFMHRGNLDADAPVRIPSHPW